MSATGRNQAGNLYGLTALCPIKIGSVGDRSHESLVRAALSDLELNHNSPFAAVPNTYLCRLFILKDVFYVSKPGREEHLKSQYLVWTNNFHGELHPYLRGMWDNARDMVQSVWEHCVGFSEVTDSAGFINYIERCQLTNALLFNGSTDQPLAEQLKGLYLKQKFGQFVIDNQQLDPADLKQAFEAFVADVEPNNLARPTWKPGAATLRTVEVI